MIAGQLELDFTTNVAKITTQIAQIKGSVTGAAREMHDAISQVKTLLGTLGVGISVKAIIDFADHTVDAMAHMKDLGEQAGITAQAMSKFEAPTRVAGSSLDLVASAMDKMSKAAVTGLNPLSSQAQAFASIGINTKELRALAPDQLFELIARQLDKYSDGISKNAVMQAIFSRGGAEMNSVMKQIAATTELHASVTQKDADEAKHFQEEIVKLEMAGDTFWRGVASEWIPTGTKLVDKMTEITTGIGFWKTELLGVASVFGIDLTSSLGTASDKILAIKNKIIDLNRAIAEQKAVLGPNADGVIKRYTDQIAVLQKQLSALQGSGAKSGPSPAGGMDEMGLPSFLASGKPAPNFDPQAILNAEAAKKAYDAENASLDAQIAKLRGVGEMEAYLKKLEGDRFQFLSEKQKKDLADKEATVLALEDQKKALAAAAEGAKAYFDAIEKADAVIAQFNDATSQQVSDLDFQNSLLGKTSDQQEKLTALRQADLDLLKQIDALPQGMSEEDRDRAIATLTQVNDLRKQGITIALDDKKAIEDQLSLWSNLGEMAGTFFSDLVQHGKSAFGDLRNMVNQLLADMIKLFAQRWILNLAAGGTMLGSATSALAGGTAGGGSLAGSLLNYGSTALGLTSAVMGGAASYAGAGMVASGMGVSAVADSMAINAAAGTVATTGVMGGVMSGVTSALASIPVYGWIALAVIAIAAWLGGKGGGPKTGGSFFGAFDSSGNLTGNVPVPGADNGRFFTPNDSDAQMQQAGQSFATGYVNAVKQLGGTGAAAFTAGLGIDNDPRGTAQSRVSSMLQMGGSTIFSATNVGVDDKAVPAEVQHQMDQMLLAALQNSDLPPAVEKVLHSITDVASATDDQIKAVLSQAQEMAGVVQGLKGVNLNLTIEDLQAFAASGETIGQTFQRIAGEITSFDSAFMTDAQKLDAAQKQITDAFGSLGLAVPKSAEEFYNLVHGLDLSTESGRSAFDALMKIAPAFQSVQQAGVAMTSALTSALSTLGNTGFGRSMTQGTISNAASQFRATHPFAAGWSDAQLVQQLGTISPQDWASYLANDPAGASLITTILTAAASLASSATPAASSFSNSVNNAASAAANLADQLGQAKGSLGDYLSSLLTDKSLSPLSPLEQQEAARQAWVKDLQAAAGGDLGAFGRIQGDTSTLLGIARQNYGSSSTYVDLFKAVFDQNAKLAGVPDYNARMIDIQTQTHQSMKDAVALLTTVSERVVAVGNKITAAVGDSGNKVAAAISSTWAAR